MTDRYERIRAALAKGPTPGEWYWSDAYHTSDGRKTWSLIGDGGFGILSCDGEENSPQSVDTAAAELIAACDPDTIRALLEERDALRDALREAQTHIAAIGYPASPDGKYNKNGEWTFSDAVPRAVDAEEVEAAFLVIRAALAQPQGASHDPENAARLIAAQAAKIEALRAEVERLKSMTAVTMGVGSGDGNLFVHGDYDSIKAAQALVLRANRLSEVLRELVEMIETNGFVWGHAMNAAHAILKQEKEK